MIDSSKEKAFRRYKLLPSAQEMYPSPPAKKAPIAKHTISFWAGLMPIASAAFSSSRIAINL